MASNEFELMQELLHVYGQKGFPTAVNFDYPGMGKSAKYIMLFLVDKSGSMSSNNKLQQAKDVTDKCDITSDNSTFYTFNTQVQQVGDKYAFKQVKPSGGTKISEALEYIFNNAQSIGGGKSVHLIVITDAEDKMTWSEAEYLKNKYDNAINRATADMVNLSGSCLLVGNGSCKAHLEYIFERYFYHTTNGAELGSKVEPMIIDEQKKQEFLDKVTTPANDLKPVDNTAKKIEFDFQQLKGPKDAADQLFPEINNNIKNLNDASKNGDIDAKKHYKIKADLQITHGLNILEKSGFKLTPRIQDLDYEKFQQSELETKKYEKEHLKKLPQINGINNKFKDLLKDDGSLLLDKLFEIQSELKDYHGDLSNDIDEIKNLQENATDFAAKLFRVNSGIFPQLSNRITCVKNKLNQLNVNKQNISDELKNDLQHMSELCEQQIHNTLDLDVATIKKTFEASVKNIGPITALDFNELIHALLTGNDDEILINNETKYDIDDEKTDMFNKPEIDGIERMNALEMAEFVFGKLGDKDRDLKQYKTNCVHYDIKYKELQDLDDDYLRDMMNVYSEGDRKRILAHISNIREIKEIEIEPFKNILGEKQDFINNKRKIQSHLKVVKFLKGKLKTNIEQKDSENEQTELMDALKSQEKKVEMLLETMKSKQINEKLNALIPFMETTNKMKHISGTNMNSFKQSFDRIFMVHSNKNALQIDDKITQDIKNVIQHFNVMKATKDEDLMQYKESLLNAKQCGFHKETKAYLEAINNRMNDRKEMKAMELQFQSMVDTLNNVPEYKCYYQTQQKQKQYKNEIEGLKKQFAAELASCDENVYKELIGLMETLHNDLKYNNIVLTKIHQIIERDLVTINDRNDKRITRLLDQVNQYGKALSDASKSALQAPKQLNKLRDAFNKQQFDFFVLKQKANDLYNTMDKNIEMKQKPIDMWNKMEVGDWLESIGTPYSNYKDVFIANDICGEDILDDSFDDKFLEDDLGIKSKLKRKKLLSKIKELKTNKFHDNEEMVDID